MMNRREFSLSVLAVPVSAALLGTTRLFRGLVTDGDAQLGTKSTEIPREIAGGFILRGNRIDHEGDGPQMEVKDLYREISALFDQPEMMDREFPMDRATDSVLVLNEPYTISHEAIDHLIGGSIEEKATGSFYATVLTLGTVDTTDWIEIYQNGELLVMDEMRRDESRAQVDQRMIEIESMAWLQLRAGDAEFPLPVGLRPMGVLVGCLHDVRGLDEWEERA